MPARVYDPSLVNLPRSKRYVAVSHDCAAHNAVVDAKARPKIVRRIARAQGLGDAILATFDRNEARRLRRGRITQTKETCAPSAKLLKRALGPHVTAPGFHHDPRVMQARSMAAVERSKALAELRRGR